MIIAVAVVKNNFFLNRLFADFAADIDFAVGFVGGFYRQFQRIEQTPCVSVRGIHKMFERACFKYDVFCSVTAFFVRKCHFCRFHQIFFFERLELKHAASAYQCFIYLKKRVFGRCADKDNRAVFYPRQKCVLLTLVPAVHFVNE